jgi:predicted ATPase/DNA-binding transcriptional regulator YiaG
MSPTELTSHPSGIVTEHPRWNEVLRALREARGVTQDGWAAQIGVSRKTVQRWEAGERSPDPGAEAAILSYCRERNLFRPFTRGPLAGLELTPDALHDLLAEARLGGGAPPALTSEEAVTPTPPRSLTAQSPIRGPESSNLPASLSSFIGRERELAAVRRALAGTRLLTLTGAGGCGKTRLALAVAEELLWAYPNGVWLVELAGLAEPALLPETVATALGVRIVDQRPLTEALVEFLRPRHLLLVLDNCEHLLPACAELVETLLRGCPHLEILATSRESLGVSGETRWRVPPMSVPGSMFQVPDGTSANQEPGTRNQELEQADAIRLFVERAQQYRPDFALTAANEAAVVQICERLDGIPLAIELAAAFVTVLSLEQIAERLSGRLQLLSGGSRTALPRHQTLRATMDWSHDLLSAREQTAFRRLSVFAGSWGLEAAESVCDDDVLDTLRRLVDTSLVNAEVQDGAVRYRMLEMVRQYAAERLDEAGETAQARDHHLDWYLALARRANAATHGPEEPAWLVRLESEHDNLRAALAWSLTRGTGETALCLAGALRRFWDQGGHISEGRQWLTRALEAGDSAPAEVRAMALHGAGSLAYKQGDYAVSRPLLEQALSLFKETANLRGIASAQDGLGCIALRTGEHAAAHTLLDACLALHTELGYKPGIASALDALGMLAIREGDNDGARVHFQAALALYRELGDKAGIAEALGDLATVIHEDGGDEQRVALLNECLTLYREIGNRQGIAMALSNLGIAAWVRGDHSEALTLLEESLTLYRSIGDRRGVARLLGNQALAALYQREYARAATLCCECLALHRELNDPWTIARYLPVLAGAVFGLGDPARSAHLFGAAAALRERLGGTLPLTFQSSHDRTVAAVRSVLGEQTFEQAWSAGQSMSWNAAVAYALEEPEAA